jgi:MFS family permease
MSIVIFSLFVAIGMMRFILPFRVLEIGKTEEDVTFLSTYLSIGQLIGLIVVSFTSRLRTQHLFVMAISFETLAIAGEVFTSNINIFAFCRIIEGIGLSIITIVAITHATELASDRMGETIGVITGMMILGGAIGQGIAGITYELLKDSSTVSKEVLIGALGLTLIALLLSLLIPSQERTITETHFHFKMLGRLLKKRIFIVLGLIYLLYDFAHGIYTPNLVIFLENKRNIPLWQSGLAFMIGDGAWGLMQIWAGKLVDQYGVKYPLFIGLIGKSLAIVGYLYTGSFWVLIAILVLVAVAESLVEPSRNTFAMSFSGTPIIMHTHYHIHSKELHNLVVDKHVSNNESLTQLDHTSIDENNGHDHTHDHYTSESFVLSTLQMIGLVGYGLGASYGGLLLGMGYSLGAQIAQGIIPLALAAIITLAYRSRK